MVGLPYAGGHWAYSLYESGKFAKVFLRVVEALKSMAEPPQEAGNPP